LRGEARGFLRIIIITSRDDDDPMDPQKSSSLPPQIA
jgi:hypothetical protein